MKLEKATRKDVNLILELYRSVLDTPYCRWSMEYPAMENIEDDLARDELFCFRENGEIIALISMDKDDEVAALSCWNHKLDPAKEISRLCVRRDYQGRGIAGELIEGIIEYGRATGIKSIRYLVSKNNLLAQKAYSRLEFRRVGECQLYHDDYWCYEKEI